jgi:preprotein translocase subunit YajC
MSPLFATKALRNTDLSSLKPGDVAITNSGIHCLVYFKGNTWIQADPNVGKVEDFDARNTESSWFDDPVHLYRWTWLQN